MFNTNITIRMIISGFVIMVTGFFYELMFTGIPLQDLALKLTSKYEFQSLIAKYIFELGLIAVSAGLIFLAVTIAQKFLNKSS